MFNISKAFSEYVKTLHLDVEKFRNLSEKIDHQLDNFEKFQIRVPIASIFPNLSTPNNTSQRDKKRTKKFLRTLPWSTIFQKKKKRIPNYSARIMERRIELRHHRWKFQESPISSPPPSLSQKFPPNSLPTSVKPPPKGINEHPIYTARGNHAGTRFPPRPWWNSPGVVSMRTKRKKERKEKTGPSLVSGLLSARSKWILEEGTTFVAEETSGGEFMRDNFHEGWKVGIRQCHERERGWRGKRKCAINVDVDGELVEFRDPGEDGRIVRGRNCEKWYFWFYVFDIIRLV